MLLGLETVTFWSVIIGQKVISKNVPYKIDYCRGGVPACRAE